MPTLRLEFYLDFIVMDYCFINMIASVVYHHLRLSNCQSHALAEVGIC